MLRRVIWQICNDLSHESAASIKVSEGSTFLRNVDAHLPGYAMSSCMTQFSPLAAIKITNLRVEIFLCLVFYEGETWSLILKKVHTAESVRE